MRPRRLQKPGHAPLGTHQLRQHATQTSEPHTTSAGTEPVGAGKLSDEGALLGEFLESGRTAPSMAELDARDEQDEEAEATAAA